MKPLLTAVAFCLLLASQAGAADPDKGKLEPGDRVEIEWAGEKVQAEFVEYFANGWITVKFLRNGIEMSPTLPPAQVRVLAKRGGAGGGAAAKRPFRTWTDTTGKFKTKARFVELAGDTVTLETDKGKSLTIPLAKLSEADQEMARKIAAKMGRQPAAAGTDDGDPFAGGTPGSGGTAPGEPAEADWSDCRVVVAVAPEGWNLPPDAVEVPRAAKPGVVPLAMTTGQNAVFDRVYGLLVARRTGRGCVVLSERPPAGEMNTRLQMVDLTRGGASAPVAFDSTLLPVDVAPDGTAILAREDHTFAAGTAAKGLGVWRIGEKALEPVALWNPRKPDNVHDTAPSHAAFIDPDHVVCVSFPDALSVWDVPRTKALWSTSVSAGSVPAISAGGKYLAVSTGGAVHVFEALTGDTLARLPGDAPPGAVLSFRPDCGQLAAVAPQRLLVWNLATGTLDHDISFPSPVGKGSVDWLEPGQVLLGGQDLVDLERRVVVWRYLHDSGNVLADNHASLGGALWATVFSEDRRSRMLVPATIPHPSAVRAAAGLDAEKLLAVRPGAAFALDVRVQGTPDEQEKVRQALGARLDAAGFVPSAATPLVLEAVTETGKSQEIGYRSFGSFGREVEKATVTEQISRVRILESGVPIWQSVSVTTAPFMLQMKENQSLQEALAPYQKPNLDFFPKVVIPSFIARPGPGGAYGFSQITPQGIVDTPPPAAPSR